MALVQDALELRNPVGAGPLKGDLVRNTNDFHGPGVARYFAVRDRHHVIQPQCLGCGVEGKTLDEKKAGGSAILDLQGVCVCVCVKATRGVLSEAEQQKETGNEISANHLREPSTKCQRIQMLPFQHPFSLKA